MDATGARVDQQKLDALFHHFRLRDVERLRYEPLDGESRLNGDGLTSVDRTPRLRFLASLPLCRRALAWSRCDGENSELAGHSDAHSVFACLPSRRDGGSKSERGASFCGRSMRFFAARALPDV
jgi:hypothetical protein